MRAYTRVYVRIRRLSAQLFILLSPVAPSAYARIRRLSPSKFKHVELSRPAQTSAGIPANHESAARSPRADALFCIGTYAGVYWRIRSPVYTFIHGATCAMQWRRAGSRKRGHLRRLPAHTRAWSINPALVVKFLIPREMHILRCMGSKFCVKFQRAPLKFHAKFWTHTPQNVHFTIFIFCVWVTISLNCEVISLCETGPRLLNPQKGSPGAAKVRKISSPILNYVSWLSDM